MMQKTAGMIAAGMADVLNEKYPNNWVVLLMNTTTGAVDPVRFEKTEQGRTDAEDFLALSTLFLPLEILVFTNMRPA